jgi:hypothetical protein
MGLRREYQSLPEFTWPTRRLIWATVDLRGLWVNCRRGGQQEREEAVAVFFSHMHFEKLSVTLQKTLFIIEQSNI